MKKMLLILSLKHLIYKKLLILMILGFDKGVETGPSRILLVITGHWKPTWCGDSSSDINHVNGRHIALVVHIPVLWCMMQWNIQSYLSLYLC